MKNFGVIYKNKIKEAEELANAEILNGFKTIYESMLNHYKLVDINALTEEAKLSFLTELNKYWNEETGLTNAGKIFINKRVTTLNENSTKIQKNNYLKDKTYNVLKDVFERANIKYRIYNVLDEMFEQTNSSNINDVLPVNTITENLKEVFGEVLNEYIDEIYNELKESANSNTKDLTYTIIKGRVGNKEVTAYVYPRKDAGLSHYKIEGEKGKIMGTVQFSEIYNIKQKKY